MSSPTFTIAGRRYPLPQSWQDAVRLLMNGLEDHTQAIAALKDQQSTTTTDTITTIVTAAIGSGKLPVSIAQMASHWLDSYNSITGQFTSSQPASTNLSDYVTAIAVHSEPITDGAGNIIFVSGDVLMAVGVPN